MGIFSKVKHDLFRLPISIEWLEFSKDTEQEPKLEKILSEKEDGSIVLTLKRKKGLKPSEYENERIKPFLDALDDSKKEYFSKLNDLAVELDVSPAHIALFLPSNKEQMEAIKFTIDLTQKEIAKVEQEYLEVTEKIKSDKGKDKSDLENQQSQLAIQKDNLTNSIVNLKDNYQEYLEIKGNIYEQIKNELGGLNSLFLDSQQKEVEYNQNLLLSLLKSRIVAENIDGTKKDLEVDLTVNDLINLHQDFIKELYSFLNKERDKSWEVKKDVDTNEGKPETSK